MTPLAPILLRSLSLASLLLLAAPSFAGEKLDLTPYLGNLGMPGDFKVFDWSTGGQRRLTVLQVLPWKKGWKEIVESELTGTDYDGTAVSEEYLIPGKQLLSGSEIFSDGLTLFVRKPAKGLKLLTTPGKVQKLKKKARLVFNGVEIGTALRLGAWYTDGFETVDTPSGTYSNALRARALSGLRLDDGFDEFVYLWDLTFWYAQGIGAVRVDTDLEVHQNGFLVHTDAWSERLSDFGTAP